MASSVCAHTYCGTKVKLTHTFIWGLKCKHFFHDHCVSQTARSNCPACNFLAPVRFWKPDASQCHCFMANCRGHAAPRAVCTDCTPAFQSRIKTTAIDVYKQHGRPGTIIDVMHLFFLQATILPEWFRLASFTEDTLAMVHNDVQSNRPSHPVVTGIWQHALAYFKTTPEIVLSDGNVWPTQYFYLKTLKTLPIALYSVRDISTASGTELTFLKQRETIFTMWTRTQEGRQVTVHRKQGSSVVLYRQATKHTILSPESLHRAVSKKHFQGVSLQEIWGEHEQAHSWLIDLIANGKLVILEQRVYATDTVTSLTAVSLREEPNLVFKVS